MHTFLEILQAYQYYGLVAFAATVFLTPAAIVIAQRLGVMDMPDTALKPHARPTPYLGGAAMCLAWSAALLLGLATGIDARLIAPVLLGGVAMSIMGLIDDVRHISPKLRLLIGGTVISLVLISTGAGSQLIDAAFVPLGIHLPPAVTSPISILLGVVIVLGACNSTNLIDGLDGLCSGVTAIISFGFFVLAAHLASWKFSETGDPARLLIAIAMFGVALGFLPWNFRPAKIFMGDAGSVLLGYSCGIMILLFAEKSILRWVIGAVLIFGLPIFDTSLAMFRRWRSGRSIFEGDRSHFYDQLVQRGLSVSLTVLVCYLLAVVYVLIGLLLTWVHQGAPVIRTRIALPLLGLVAVVTALLAWLGGLTRPEERRMRL
jgi:UDP-GlcNAc:undecaprenyl-phosphate GlcNAc-1-phosphate transferase